MAFQCNMLDRLPMELVCAILRTASETFLVPDRTTVLNLARSFGLAYTVAIPVIYRTLTVNKNNQAVLPQMFDEPLILSNAGGLLAIPPTERLWRHVRRLFVEPAVQFNSIYFRHLVNLQAFYTFRPFTTAQHSYLSTPANLTHIYTLAAVTLSFVPPNTTHASFYVGIHGQMGFRDIQTHVHNVLPATVTHLAIELSGSLSREQEKPLQELLNSIITRSEIELVAFRIYSDAVKNEYTIDMVRRTAKTVHDPTHRVRLWLDRRQIEDIRDDVAASREDAVAGRTPWSEAEPLLSIEGVR